MKESSRRHDDACRKMRGLEMYAIDSTEPLEEKRTFTDWDVDKRIILK
jgi:hypothetical protein